MSIRSSNVICPTNAFKTVEVLVRFAAISIVVCIFASINATSTQADDEFSPEHPDVKAMVAKGMAFLSDPNIYRARSQESYDILMGYTAYKATEDAQHFLVLKALPMAQKMTRDIQARADMIRGSEILYETAVCGMFFSAVDGVKYRPELEALRDFIETKQRPDGSFGYQDSDGSRRGDASQTQYMTLVLWSFKHANLDVNPSVLEKTNNWLRQAQRPDGGWTYQTPPTDPAPTHSMLAAGLSAVLISADALGVLRGSSGKDPNSEELPEEDDDGVPDVFRRVYLDPKDEKKNFVSKSITKDSLKRVAVNAQKWLKANTYNRRAGLDWFYYWLYSRERFESFMEILEGKRAKFPVWYQDGVRQLGQLQDPKTGGWGVTDSDPGGHEAATCFAILFLLRTTQKAIGELSEVSAKGGQSLANVADASLVDGKVVDKSAVTNLDDMLKMLETNKEGSAEGKVLADRIKLESDPQARRDQLNRFARMLRSPNWSARRLAAKIIGRGDDLDYAPDLIYALSDGDLEVRRIAENSLRILSRQMDTALVPKDTPMNNEMLVAAERYWKNWYLSVRPDHIFVD